jgi:ATP-dependent Clp protease adaptor protein ClpS
MTEDRSKRSTEVIDKPEQEVRQPTLYRVVLHNDDYTTMDFVVEVLMTVFFMPPAQAYRVMLQVHSHGRGVCGVYPLEIAETKVVTVHQLAREHGFPLMASVEEA